MNAPIEKKASRAPVGLKLISQQQLQGAMLAVLAERLYGTQSGIDLEFSGPSVVADVWCRIEGQKIRKLPSHPGE